MNETQMPYQEIDTFDPTRPGKKFLYQFDALGLAYAQLFLMSNWRRLAERPVAPLASVDTPAACLRKLAKAKCPNKAESQL